MLLVDKGTGHPWEPPGIASTPRRSPAQRGRTLRCCCHCRLCRTHWSCFRLAEAEGAGAACSGVVCQASAMHFTQASMTALNASPICCPVSPTVRPPRWRACPMPSIGPALLHIHPVLMYYIQTLREQNEQPGPARTSALRLTSCFSPTPHCCPWLRAEG